jgi:uncharacterized protein YjbJ (UPF0337 family)
MGSKSHKGSTNDAVGKVIGNTQMEANGIA